MIIFETVSEFNDFIYKKLRQDTAFSNQNIKIQCYKNDFTTETSEK